MARTGSGAPTADPPSQVSKRLRDRLAVAGRHMRTGLLGAVGGVAFLALWGLQTATEGRDRQASVLAEALLQTQTLALNVATAKNAVLLPQDAERNLQDARKQLDGWVGVLLNGGLANGLKTPPLPDTLQGGMLEAGKLWLQTERILNDWLQLANRVDSNALAESARKTAGDELAGNLDKLTGQFLELRRSLQGSVNLAATVWASLSAVFWVLLAVGLWARIEYRLGLARQEGLQQAEKATETALVELREQYETELKAHGAELALRNVLQALNQTAENTQRATDRAHALNEQQRKAHSHALLQMAHAFHNLSSEATLAAKTALKSQQTVNEGSLKAQEATLQWEALREDVRRTAAGLRRAGESSRLLSEALSAEIPTADPAQWAALITQTREALREAVTGLASSTQKIAHGETLSKDTAASLAKNQAAWLHVLDSVERCAGTAAGQAQSALGLVRSNQILAQPTPPALNSDSDAKSSGASSEAVKTLK